MAFRGRALRDEEHMSFALTGLKWGPADYGEDGGTVTWHADFSGLNFDTSTYSVADFDNALSTAFQDWEDVADIDFQRVGSPAASDVDFFMSPLSGSTVGLATMFFTPTPGTPDPIVEASIELDSTEGWAPFGSTDLSFYAVALHEIGHVLGLEHVNDTSEIMNPVVFANSLGDGDIAGAQVVYGADTAAGSVLAPPGADPLSFIQPPSSPTFGDDDDGGGDGGGSGGAGLVALILGLIAAVFGGGLAGGAMALAARRDEDDEDRDGGDVAAETDELLLPAIFAFDDPSGVPVYQYVHFHGDGPSPCGCHAPCNCDVDAREDDIVFI
ncbi:MAG: matrixin family metalloprotease [Pseudomonadota bacterium]